MFIDIFNLFNQLDIASKVFIYFVLIVTVLWFLNNLIGLILKKIRFFFNTSYSKYKSFNENRFNSVLYKHIVKKLHKTNKFIVLCNFNLGNSTETLLDIMTEFSLIFSRNFEVKITYDKNFSIFIFEDLHNTIDVVLDNFYQRIDFFDKKYPETKICISLTELEENNTYTEQLNFLKRLNKLNFNKKIITTASFKFYYENFKKGHYSVSSIGDYLMNGNVEVFTLEANDHTT